MPRNVRAAQNVSRMCLVCGTQNPGGLRARFLELDGGELAGVFDPREMHQGYPGRLHGGIAAALLDETIGRAVSLTDPKAWGVTVELALKFRHPVPLDRPVTAIGRITRDSRRIFEGAGEIVLHDGTVAVQATGRYLRMPLAQIAEGRLADEWIADDRPRPDRLDV